MSTDLIASDLIKPPRFMGLRMDRQQVIKAFFSGSAGVTILTLFLIMWSLLREGSGFLSTYRWELAVYRKAGLEFCDYVQKPLSEHEQLLSRLKRGLGAELDTVVKSSRDRRDAALLLKNRVEEKAALQREALQDALEKKDAPVPQEKIAQLRLAVTEANAKALASEALPDLFTT